MQFPAAIGSLGILAIAALLCSGALRGEPASVSACVDAGPLTIYVVRHAEREEDGSDDPGLSPAGHARARALADSLAGSDIDAVYVTQLRRTGDTAGPLVTRQQPRVHTWPVARGQVEQHVDSLADAVCNQHAGQTLLIIGHSNTVTQIVTAISGRSVAQITECEYDHLYQVRLIPGDSAQILEARYGEPDRPACK